MELDNQKVRIITKALMEGLAVEKDGETFRMGEDGDICTKMINIKSKGGGWVQTGDTWAKLDMSAGAYFRWCSRFSDDDVFVIAANIALNDMK